MEDDVPELGARERAVPQERAPSYRSSLGDDLTFPLAGATIPRMVCAVVVLPQPDSPTRASISPRASVKLTPSTACTQPLGWRATRSASPRRTG